MRPNPVIELGTSDLHEKSFSRAVFLRKRHLFDSIGVSCTPAPQRKESAGDQADRERVDQFHGGIMLERGCDLVTEPVGIGGNSIPSLDTFKFIKDSVYVSRLFSPPGFRLRLS